MKIIKYFLHKVKDNISKTTTIKKTTFGQNTTKNKNKIK